MQFSEQATTLKSDWMQCKRCGLHKTRRRVVLGRGELEHKTFMFVGEGPGQTEDATGEAFKGRAGSILNSAIRYSKIANEDCFFTNLVACRPCDAVAGENRPPSSAEITACWPRLRLTCLVIRPKLIIALGRVPSRWVPDLRQPYLELQHPAYIARRGGERSQEFQIFVRELTDAREEIGNGTDG